MIKLEVGLSVAVGAGEVRHAAAGEHRHSLRTLAQYASQRLAKLVAARGDWLRRHIDVDEERDDRNPSLAQHVVQRDQ